MFIRLYAPDGMRLPQSFESFVDAIATWPGMFVEPDGSFVWAIDSGIARYQLDGMVYDRAGAIEYVELKGTCDARDWQRLCEALLPNSGGVDRWDQRMRVHDVDGSRWVAPSRFALELESHR
jgi:hypothetical protein